MIKVLTSETLASDTTAHATVYSNKGLSVAKAAKAAKSHLRAQGFIVTDVVVDMSTERSAMVSAYIQ